MTTNADLKSIHEYLAVPTDWLAARMGVTDQTVWKYERTSRGDKPLPDYVTEALAELVHAREAAEQRAAAIFEGAGRLLPRYESGDQWRVVFPEFEGWPDSAQGPFVGALSVRLGIGVEFIPAE